MAKDKDKHAAYMREWRAANLDKARANARASYQRNKAKRNAESKQWYEQNKGRAAELAAARYQRNKRDPEWRAKRGERQRRYREANRDKVNAHRRQYMAENRDKQRAWTKNGRAKHGDKMNAASRQWFRDNPDYAKKRYAEDVQFKLKHVIRGRFSAALKGNRKSGRAIDLLGCTIEEFRHHIEAQWAPGMTWENHRRYGWHIDHIRPLNSFDLTDPAQQAAACHYTNLQPLWWRQNISKRDRWEGRHADSVHQGHGMGGTGPRGGGNPRRGAGARPAAGGGLPGGRVPRGRPSAPARDGGQCGPRAGGA